MKKTFLLLLLALTVMAGSAVAQVIVGQQTCKNPKNADLNSDNKITITDLTLLVNRIMGRQ